MPNSPLLTAADQLDPSARPARIVFEKDKGRFRVYSYPSLRTGREMSLPTDIKAASIMLAVREAIKAGYTILEAPCGICGVEVNPDDQWPVRCADHAEQSLPQSFVDRVVCLTQPLIDTYSEESGLGSEGQWEIVDLLTALMLAAEAQGYDPAEVAGHAITDYLGARASLSAGHDPEGRDDDPSLVQAADSLGAVGAAVKARLAARGIE